MVAAAIEATRALPLCGRIDGLPYLFQIQIHGRCPGAVRPLQRLCFWFEPLHFCDMTVSERDLAEVAMAAGGNIAPDIFRSSGSAKKGVSMRVIDGKVAVVQAGLGGIGIGLLILEEGGLRRTGTLYAGEFEVFQDTWMNVIGGAFVVSHHATQGETADSLRG